MKIEFAISGIPTAKGRPRLSTRGGFARAYTPQKTRDAESLLAAQAWHFRPSQPLEGPIELTVTFVMPIPASWSKSKQQVAKLRPHCTKPDLDNLIKLVKDSLNGMFWSDDKQVYKVFAAKVYGPIPQTIISIEQAAEKVSA